MQTKTTIRPPKESDYVQWRPLWDGYNAFYGREEATALPGSITKQTWERFHSMHEPVHALVAELDGRLVGLAHYLTTTVYLPQGGAYGFVELGWAADKR